MKRLFKKIIKILLILIGVLVIAGIALYFIYNQPLPEGETGPKAEALAQKMLKATNYKAYQKTRYFEWSYAGGKHHYKWDKHNGQVEVQWDDYLVNLDLISPKSSIAYKSKERMNTQNAEAVIEKAISYFNNDSFWLVAPFKVFDKGTTRSIVVLEDGTEGLLVSYASGGTTPGDAYLWKLNAEGVPISYQMWVKIIPINGLEATWDDWKVMKTGVHLPGSHTLGPITLSMGEVKAY